MYIITNDICYKNDIIAHEEMLGFSPNIFKKDDKWAIEVSGKLDYGIKPVKKLGEGWYEQNIS